MDSVIVSIKLGKNEQAKGKPAVRLDLAKKKEIVTNKTIKYVCSYWKGEFLNQHSSLLNLKTQSISDRFVT